MNDLDTTCNNLLTQALKNIKDKGWVVTEYKQDSSHEWACSIRVEFFFFAPPTVLSGISYPDLKNGTPAYLFGGRVMEEALRRFLLWSEYIPSFDVPFGQGICDKCLSQGGDWYFSKVHCTSYRAIAEDVQHPIILVKPRVVEFASGLPQTCPYLVEQTVTMTDRCIELNRIGYFEKSPEAERLCAKWTKTCST